jgi:hypothetical protein
MDHKKLSKVPETGVQEKVAIVLPPIPPESPRHEKHPEPHIFKFSEQHIRLSRQKEYNKSRRHGIPYQ